MRPEDEQRPAPEPDVPRAEDRSAAPDPGEHRRGAEQAEMKTSPFEPPPMERVDLSDDHGPPPDRD
jgi:hypothetical protein